MIVGGVSSIILMGICYSQQQQWQPYKQGRRNDKKRPRRERKPSVIYQEKTVYDSSFASNMHTSFREDIHRTISEIAQEDGSLFMGSIVEMREEELKILYKSLHKLSAEGETHREQQPIILCNLKTKNYMHTHKIKIPQSKINNQVSCCPFNSNHIAEYDIWKFIKVSENQHMVPNHQLDPEDEIINAYIYHPFTQRFLTIDKGQVVGSQSKKIWQIRSFGRRRNGGFISIGCEEGELCMSENKGLLANHRRLQICPHKHVSHLWQIMFISAEDI